MGALAPLSSWIPEDDFLLKSAIEAGASLESLAKGAVQFSRKFTVKELQERWHSLLYDPVVSAEASFRMIEFEHSATTLPSKFSRPGSRDNKCASGKRKVESVRNCFYAWRKRIRNEPFNPMDLSFLISPTDENYMANEHCILGDPVSDEFELQDSDIDIMNHDFKAEFQNVLQEDFSAEVPQLCGESISQAVNGALVEEYVQPNDLAANVDQVNGCAEFDEEFDFSSPVIGCDVAFHNLDYSSPLPEMTMWGPAEGVSSPSIPLNIQTGESYPLPDDGDAKNTCLPEFHMGEDANLELEIPSENMKTVPPSTEVYLAELSNSLLNFTNEEELLFTEDGKDTIDKSYYDGLSSLLLNSPIDASQDRMVDTTQPNVNLDHLKDQEGVGHGVIDRDAIVSSNVQQHTTIFGSDADLPGMKDGIIICSLSTEDQEIPCNDHVVFTRPKPFSSLSRRGSHDVSRLNPSSVREFSSNLNTNDRVLTLIQKDKDPLPQIRPRVIPENASLHRVDDNGMKFDHQGLETGEGLAMNRFCHNVVDCSMQKPAVGLDVLKCSQSNASIVKQELNAPPRVQQYQASNTKLESLDISASERIANDQLPEAEEPPIESDDDNPYFSDIEAMILDMDLDPEDQDIYSSEEVSRYQQEDTKRLIVRLEQGARSYMQRNIESQGAFAVLYGRHSKHYIKKPEVLLGRGTEDVVVDIDLWREGRGNKVSRRQAIINLDKSGSFHMKNLGKLPMFVNDKEIFHGQSLPLPNSCLIEIRGMPFIFETNEARVKQYLDKLKQL